MGRDGLKVCEAFSIYLLVAWKMLLKFYNRKFPNCCYPQRDVIGKKKIVFRLSLTYFGALISDERGEFRSTLRNVSESPFIRVP